jgi:hypothetical protein
LDVLSKQVASLVSVLDTTDGKLGIFGATPVVQQTATDLAGGASLSDVITKVNGIIDKLKLYGIFG